MFLRYIQIILLLTIIMHAAPKTYASLANELEPLQKDCKIYQNSTLLPKAIKNSCKKYSQKVSTAFKLGYKIDPYIDSDTVSEKKLNKYLKLLKDADEDRETLTPKIKREIIKARTGNHVQYYSQLIRGVNQLTLHHEDYIFMKQHQGELHDNPIFVKYMTMVDKRIQAKKQIKETKKLAKKKEREEHNKKILAEAQRDLEKQIAESKIKKTLPGELQKRYTGCKEGKPLDCAVLGGAYFEGRGIKRNLKHARLYYKKGCDIGQGLGYEVCCSELAWYYYEGKGGEQNANKAKYFYNKACQGGDNDGCKKYNRLNTLGTKELQFDMRIKSDYKYASLLCEQGNTIGCYHAGRMIADGEKIERNHSKARLLYKKACDGGNNEGCRELGILYLLGKGGDKNTYRGKELLNQACRATGDELACMLR